MHEDLLSLSGYPPLAQCSWRVRAAAKALTDGRAVGRRFRRRCREMGRKNGEDGQGEEGHGGRGEKFPSEQKGWKGIFLNANLYSI